MCTGDHPLTLYYSDHWKLTETTHNLTKIQRCNCVHCPLYFSWLVTHFRMFPCPKHSLIAWGFGPVAEFKDWCNDYEFVTNCEVPKAKVCHRQCSGIILTLSKGLHIACALQCALHIITIWWTFFHKVIWKSLQGLKIYGLETQCCYVTTADLKIL